MMRVFVEHYDAVAIGSSTQLLTDALTVRRMSWLQKATMEALTRYQRAAAARLDEVLERLHAPIYFCTEHGEIDATLTVAASLINRQLPVSPTAFQHSVHNAGAGYVTIATKTRNPSATVSSGFLSFDKTIFWAFEELRRGRQQAVILVRAGEHANGAAPDVIAECELLVLTTDHREPPALNPDRRWELMAVGYGSLSAAEQDRTTGSTVGSPGIHEAAIDRAFVPLRLDRKKASFHRIVTSADTDERIVSRWSL